MNIFSNLPTSQSWHIVFFVLLIFFLPSIAVTVESGATTTFWLLSIIAIIFFWRRQLELQKLEVIFLYGITVFSLVMGLSLINAEDFSDGLSSYERYIRFLFFVPLYLYVRRYKLNLGQVVGWGLIAGCFVIGVVAIYQYHVLSMPQPMGARQINRFGFAAVTMFLLLVVYIIFNWRKKWVLAAASFASFVIIYGIMLNKTRGAIMCVIPFVVLLVFVFKNEFDNKKVIIFTLISVLLLVIFFHPISPVAQYFYIGVEQLAAFIEDPLNNYANSWGIRAFLMYHGLLIYMQSPILGTGLGDYHADLRHLMESGQLLVNDPIMLSGSHNIFIHMLAETGTIGFLAFVFFVFMIPIYIYLNFFIKHRDSREICTYALSGLTFMICHFTFGMVNTWLTNNAISIFLILNLIFISNLFALTNKEGKG